jgi:hypothetical protein
VPFFLRKITKSKWLPADKHTWLASGEIAADVLCDFQTKLNTLSVYEIDDERSNLMRVVAAIAATRNSVQHLEYALIERKRIEEIGVKCIKIGGKTGDEKVNDCHYDLIELSASKIVDIAKIMFSESEKDVVFDKDIGNSILEGIQEGHIIESEINGDLLPKLEKYRR